MNTPSLETALARYVQVLAECADGTHHAEDRSVFTGHLAAAARMSAALRGPVNELKALVASERHAYGWGYLSGEHGERAERAFDEFARFVETVPGDDG